MPILNQDRRGHGVLTLKFEAPIERVLNAAAIAKGKGCFHISLTDAAVGLLKQGGMNLVGWITFPVGGCHLGNPQGGTRYIMGFSGFSTEQDALVWFRSQLPNGWLVRP